MNGRCQGEWGDVVNSEELWRTARNRRLFIFHQGEAGKLRLRERCEKGEVKSEELRMGQGWRCARVATMSCAWSASGERMAKEMRWKARCTEERSSEGRSSEAKTAKPPARTCARRVGCEATPKARVSARGNSKALRFSCRFPCASPNRTTPTSQSSPTPFACRMRGVSLARQPRTTRNSIAATRATHSGPFGAACGRWIRARARLKR